MALMYLNVVLLQRYDGNLWRALEVEHYAENLSVNMSKTAWMLYHCV